MLKKAMITAAMGAAIVGGGTAALASSGEHATSPAGSTTATAPTSTASTAKAPPTTKTKPTAKTRQQKRRARRVQLGRALHASWVTKGGVPKGGKTTTFVTHDAIHGTVTEVTSTAITIKAADGYSERFLVSGSTTVRMRVAGQAKGNASSIGQVKTGAKVLVIGTGQGTPTATRIVAGLKR